jgi:hypothetical protein
VVKPHLQPSFEPVQPPPLVLCFSFALLSALFCKAALPYLLMSFAALFSAAFLSLDCSSKLSRLAAISLAPLCAARTDTVTIIVQNKLHKALEATRSITTFARRFHNCISHNVSKCDQPWS